MKKNYFLLIFLLTTMICISQNLAANPGFEEFVTGQPVGWPTIESGITVEQETTIKSEGSASGKFTLTTATQGNTDFRQTIDVFAGIEYQISVDVYHVAGDNDGRTRLYIDGYENYSDRSIVDQWQTIELTYLATGDESIEFGFRFYDVAGFDGSSVMYIDNIEVIDPNILTVNTPGKLDFLLFPNPTTKGFVTVNTTTSNEATFVSVYNVLGEKVISETLKNNCLDVSNLNTGIYILNVFQNKTSVSKKLVIK